MIGRRRKAAGAHAASTDSADAGAGPDPTGDPFEGLVRAFEDRADPSRADAMSAYMRNEFAFLGLQAPLRRKLAKPFMMAMRGGDESQLLDAAERLWGMPQREYAYVATDLLRAEWRALTPEALARLRGLVQSSSWWDTVDPLSHVVGVLVLNHRELVDDMDRWVGDEDRWVVRVALLHQLGWKGAADAERLFRYCLARGGDQDFFIRKAIGWALRDLARTFPEQVEAFVAEHGGELSTLSVSEATKHL